MKRALQAPPPSPQEPERDTHGMGALPEVLFIDDLARLLRISRRTIDKLRRHRVFPIPELASLDKRARWSRTAVAEFLAGGAPLRRGPVELAPRRRG